MDDPIFPVRHGGSSGKSEENRLLDNVGGPNTIRTKIVQTPEGELMLRTRGGFPEFTLNKKQTVLSKDRTFVFRQMEASFGVVANRAGDSLGVVKRDVAITAPAAYSITKKKTDGLVKWFDVLRIEGTTIKINGKVASFLPTVTPDFGETSVPCVVDYVGSCVGDSTRSPLFVAHNRSVSSISTTGTEKSVVTASNDTVHSALSSAGIQGNNGRFDFYGADVALSLGDNTPWQATVAWSKINAALTSPFVSESGSAYSVVQLRVPVSTHADNFAAVYTHGATQSSSGYSVAPIVKPYKIGRSGMDAYYTGGAPNWPYHAEATYSTVTGPDTTSNSGTSVTTGAGGTDLVEVLTYAYGSAPLKLSLNAEIICDYTGLRENGSSSYKFTGYPAYNYFGGSRNQTVISASSSSTVKLSCALGNLVDVSVSFSEILTTGTKADPVDSETPIPSSIVEDKNAFSDTLVSQILSDPASYGYPDFRVYPPKPGTIALSTNAGGSTITMLVKTVDHAFADPDEEIYLTLESELSGSLFTPVSGAQTNEYLLKLKYVLNVRGTKHDFEVYTGSAFAKPIVHTRTVFTGGAFSEQYGNYHAALKPTPVFSPVFMSQGNCPYIAYTTKAEESAGATPEIYVDFYLLAERYSTYVGGDNYNGKVHFVPHHFMYSFRQYLAAESMTTGAFTQNQTLWEDLLFPTGVPFKVQFANGIKGVWQSKLGAGFTGYPSMEITRI